MKVNKLREIAVKDGIRDASFLSEDHLALITPCADVWRLSLISDDGELMFSGDEILKCVARKLGAEKPVKAAEGEYPCLAASPNSEWIVVNSHDAVLVACRKRPHSNVRFLPFRSATEMRLISDTWGIYYPAMQFSPDGGWLAIDNDGTSMVFNMHTLSWQELQISAPFAWHPRHGKLMGFNSHGEIVWMDVTQPDPSPEILGDLKYDSVSRNVAGIWLEPSGEFCVTVLPGGDWMCYQLWPFRLRSHGNVGGGGCWKIHGRSGVSWMAVQSRDSIWVGNLDRIQISTWIELPSAIEARFSPSGRRLVTMSPLQSSNPYPVNAALEKNERTATLWELDPTA
jgi:hypothetical protein